MQRSNTVTSAPPHHLRKPEQGPGSRTFFEKSPAGNAARTTYLKIFLGGTFSVVLMVFCIFPIYWGALWKIPAHNLQGWVVDFDGGLVGQTVSQALGSNQGASKVTWTVLPASHFPGGLQELADAVRNEDTWTAVAVNTGTTARLMAALVSPDPSYDGSQAITAYAVEARNENGFRNLIRPSVQGTLDVITRTLAEQIARNAANSTSFASILVSSPQTIVSPVYYTLNNLIPFDQPVASAATFVGMLYQLIMGFFLVMIANGAREASGYDKTLSTRNLVALRLASSFFAYFIVSLFYSLLNLAFQLDVSRKFGHAGFLVFWMVNYVGMLAVCLALESLTTLLGTRGIPFFMLTWIITNLSVSIFPIEVLPGIFRYGYAFPFFNLSRGLRTIIFGTRNHLGQTVGILLTWVVISCITLTLIQWFVRRKPSEPQPNPVDSEKRNINSLEQGYEHPEFGKKDTDIAVLPESSSTV